MRDPATPIPSDIPLPLPIPAGLLSVLLVAFFTAHILFVNLMLGGSLLALAFEVAGLRRARFDALAHEIARTVTVTKSVAVVLGVGPLLAINLLYTIPFYAANRVTGRVWLLIVPLTIAAFLLGYLHHYAWERLREHKAIHIAIGALAAAIFLSIPLIFLANINLMLFPEKWRLVQESGFLSALLIDNVLPRYLHFLLAAIAGTGLFLVWYLTRPAFPLAERLPAETRGGLRRRFYTIALIASLIQLVAGPMVLLTLPPQGLSGMMLLHILLGAALALLAMWWMWLEVARPITDADAAPALGRRFWRIVAVMTLVVLSMATGRQMYRATVLAPYQAQVAAKTAERQALSAHYRAHPARAEEEDPLAGRPGYAAFKQACMSCHAVEDKLVGPPLTEISRLYADGDGVAGIAAWTRTVAHPRLVRGRADYPARMPAVGPAQIGDNDLAEVARFMIEAGRR